MKCEKNGLVRNRSNNLGEMNRRSMIKAVVSAGATIAGVSPLHSLLVRTSQNSTNANIFDPKKFGAKGDGRSADTRAFQQTIDVCSQSGGGTVSVSPGQYIIGTIVLKSNVNLFLQSGATLLANMNMNDYSIPEDARIASHNVVARHLIFAYKAENISITGTGTIDGQSHFHLSRNARPEPAKEDMWKEVVAWNWRLGTYISPMVEIAECKNVLIENITLQNAAGWTLRPVACDGVTIRGIRIRNPIYSPNADGIDPSCSQNVLISNCDIFTGDDAICVKSFNPYGENKTSRNVLVTNCKLSTCCNGFKVGVEGPGGFENITFKDSTVWSGDVPFNERVISGIAIEMADNGWINGVNVSNITMKNVRTPIFIRLQNSYRDKSAQMAGRLQNVNISNVQATGAILSNSITGLPNFPVENITLKNIHISTQEAGDVAWTKNAVPELPNNGPEARMFGRLPAFGFYCRHVKGLQFQDVHVHSETNDPRPLVACEDVSGLSATMFNATGASGVHGLIELKNVQDASFQNCSVTENVGVYASISGSQCRNISFKNNDLHLAKTPFEIASDVPENAVQVSAAHDVSR
jgi:polygalacturonase